MERFPAPPEISQEAQTEPAPPAHDGLNVVVSTSDDRGTGQIRVVPAKPFTALHQADCDFVTGKILLLLLQGEQMNKTATVL